MALDLRLQDDIGYVMGKAHSDGKIARSNQIYQRVARAASAGIREAKECLSQVKTY
jgi:hypothetical protein